MSEIRSQATPARDELAALSDTIWRTETTDFGGYSGRDARAVADHLWAEGYRKPRTVNSATELDALPVGSVVWTQALIPGPVGHIFVKCTGMWIIPWHDTAEDPLEKNGSVTVLFTPGEAG